MKEKNRDRIELFLQKAREKSIELDEALTGPASQFRETILFIRSRPLYLRWITVVLSVGVFWIAGLPIQENLSVARQLLLFIPPVLISSLYGGSLAGAAAASLSAAYTTYAFFPALTTKDAMMGGVLDLLLFFLACGIVISLARTQESHRQDARKFAGELEDRVLERTKELEDANQELAGFCYSISHDLRAPMRNIVGSSRILVEDCSEGLDSEAQLRLRGMAQSANRLSSLVDDLLDYARLANAELRVERIEISDLVEAIVHRARNEEWPFTRISLKVQPGLVAGGDGALVALAIRNIVENACKYCKPNQALSLEFGETRLRGHLWYFIRDNGIGFDMQYAKKIFEPFQRLHRDVDVPGTGIGLANVKRIFERHDGEVFAEATPGMGSTFYFRLGSKLPVRPQSTDSSSHRVVMAEEA